VITCDAINGKGKYDASITWLKIYARSQNNVAAVCKLMDTGRPGDHIAEQRFDVSIIKTENKTF
jgi:hypothetical protein